MNKPEMGRRLPSGVETIKRLLSRSDYDEVCAAAKREAETNYSEEANYNQLMEIYGDVVRRSKL